MSEPDSYIILEMNGVKYTVPAWTTETEKEKHDKEFSKKFESTITETPKESD